MGSVLAVTVSAPASAALSRISLGAAESFAVLAGAAITVNTATTITGDLGTKIGSSNNTITGSDLVTPGPADIALAGDITKAVEDLKSAYDEVGALSFTALASAELGGQTRGPGVYKTETAFGLTGVLTLDGKNDPHAVFILQTAGALTTAANSSIVLTNGAQACNVFWRLGAAATFGANTSFAGVVMANDAITAGDGAKFSGPLFSNTAAITLSGNTIVNDGCASVEEAAPEEEVTPVTDPVPPAPVTDTQSSDDGNPEAEAEPLTAAESTASPQPRVDNDSSSTAGTGSTGTGSTSSPQPRSETNSAPGTGTGFTRSPESGSESNPEALLVNLTVPGGVLPTTDAHNRVLPLGVGLSLALGAAGFLLRMRHGV